MLKKLTSRKFWLAVGSFIVLIANGAYTEAVAVIISYIGVEGAADVAERKESAKTEQFKVENALLSGDTIDDVDTSKIESGSGL